MALKFRGRSGLCYFTLLLSADRWDPNEKNLDQATSLGQYQQTRYGSRAFNKFINIIFVHCYIGQGDFATSSVKMALQPSPPPATGADDTKAVNPIIER